MVKRSDDFALAFCKQKGHFDLTRREFTLYELWLLCGTLTCVFTLGLQLIWPQWYRCNRATTLQYVVMSLWVWESSKLLVDANDDRNLMMEVVFFNAFMFILHRVPFFSQFQWRSCGGLIQAGAIMCKSISLRLRLQILCLALVGHFVGLGLAYIYDRQSRKQLIHSLSPWLLEDLAGRGIQAPAGYLSYRASFSRRTWRIIYPDLPEGFQQQLQRCSAQHQPQPVRYNSSQFASQRALGGFAGGFGGVSGLKCTRPVHPGISPSSLSSLSGDGSSNASSNDWVAEQTSSGIFSIKVPNNATPCAGGGGGPEGFTAGGEIVTGASVH